MNSSSSNRIGYYFLENLEASWIVSFCIIAVSFLACTNIQNPMADPLPEYHQGTMELFASMRGETRYEEARKVRAILHTYYSFGRQASSRPNILTASYVEELLGAPDSILPWGDFMYLVRSTEATSDYLQVIIREGIVTDLGFAHGTH